MHTKAVEPWALRFLGLILLWGCLSATVTMAAEQRPSQSLGEPAPLSSASRLSTPTAPLLEPSSESEIRAHRRTPPKTTAPVPSRSEERRGKYSNPYDRSVPLQGDTHKGYAPARRDAFKR